MEPVPQCLGKCPLLDGLVILMNVPQNTSDPSRKPHDITAASSPAAIAMGAAPPNPREQWLSATLSLRSELKFDTRAENGKPFVVIEDPVRSKFFQTGIEEFDFIAALDGQRTAKQILDGLPGVSGEKLTPDQAVTICQWLVQSNLVISESFDSSKRLGAQASAIQKQKLMGWVNPISFKVTLFNPNRLLAACQGAFSWLFSLWFLLLWLATGAVAMNVLYCRWDDLGQASAGILSDSSWISLLVFWLLLKVIHECAHGLACRKYGGEVPEAGVLFLLFTPMAFVNVTSMWRFSSRWHRIVVAAAGMYVELFISFVALIVWSRSAMLVADIAYNVFLMASITTVLFNANPLMRFDGYFILSDLLNVPNLYTKGTRWFGDRCRHWFFGTPKTGGLFATGEGTIVRGYGALAWFWKWSISVGLVIGASVMFHGAGLLLGIIGAVLWIGLPIFNQMKALFGPNAKISYSKRRTIISGLGSVGVLACLFFVLKAPATKSAPAIVQFSDETIVRAAADGFVDKILVINGQIVQPGQELIRMHNDDLDTEINQITSKLTATKIQARIYRQQGDLSLCNVELETIAGLEAQLAEKKSQRGALVLRSPSNGRIFQRNLSDLVGSFVKQGDALMNVAAQDTKELVVSVDQADLESIKSNIGKQVRVMLPGRPVFTSSIKRIDPRASDQPTELRLCANSGGPLPVKPNPNAITGDDSQPAFVLLSPRFDAYVSVDRNIGKQIHSGQRGRVFFSATEQSLGSYFFLATREWLKKKIEMAVETTTM